MQFNFTGKTALVTGSDRNTGAIIANRLAQDGAIVIIHSNDRDGLGASAAEDLPGRYFVAGDIATEAGCEAVLGQLQSQDLEVNLHKAW